jgi:hypothetical protein
MRVKLKYVLPLAQMALAVVLLRLSYLWMRTITHSDSPGPDPAFSLLLSINAPAALARTLWSHRLPYLWDNVTFVAAIGMFWYWIALNIQSWRERRRTLLLFAWTPLRIGADLLVIAGGVCLVWLCLDAMSGPHVPWLWFVPTSILIWSVGPMFFFGRDLIHCVRRKSPKIGN